MCTVSANKQLQTLENEVVKGNVETDNQYPLTRMRQDG